MVTRGFSGGPQFAPPQRTIDDDAPLGLRREFLDIAFHLAENHTSPTPDQIYRVIFQSLGLEMTANPFGGYRNRANRDIGTVPWPRFYDLVERLALEFRSAGLFEAYRVAVNPALAANGVVWDIGGHGKLERALPAVARVQVATAFGELGHPRYVPALALLESARQAYDDRPRRDRDACANAFDAMESVAKEKYVMPSATFGQVVAQIEQTKRLHPDIIGVLQRVNQLRNRNFGHGMTTPFTLTGPDVDFTYLTCLAGILLFSRQP
jgi:hypothetical protein